jgi:hypothetical protein
MVSQTSTLEMVGRRLRAQVVEQPTKCPLRVKSRHRRESPLVTAVARIFLSEPSSFLSRQADHQQFALSRRRDDDVRCKTDQIRAAWATGDRLGALRIAAQFFDRSTATKTFQRGIQAYNHPQFFCQLGKDPQELIRAALALLAKRFDLR